MKTIQEQKRQFIVKNVKPGDVFRTASKIAWRVERIEPPTVILTRESGNLRKPAIAISVLFEKFYDDVENGVFAPVKASVFIKQLAEGA